MIEATIKDRWLLSRALPAAAALHIAAGLLLIAARPALPKPMGLPHAIAVSIVASGPSISAALAQPPADSSPFADLRVQVASAPSAQIDRPHESLSSLLDEGGAPSRAPASRQREFGEAYDPLGRLMVVQGENTPPELRTLVDKCWRARVTGPSIVMSFTLDAQGRLLTPPIAVKDQFSSGATPREQAAAEAIQRCAPYPAALGRRSYIIKMS